MLSSTLRLSVETGDSSCSPITESARDDQLFEDGGRWLDRARGLVVGDRRWRDRAPPTVNPGSGRARQFGAGSGARGARHSGSRGSPRRGRLGLGRLGRPGATRLRRRAGSRRAACARSPSDSCHRGSRGRRGRLDLLSRGHWGRGVPGCRRKVPPAPAATQRIARMPVAVLL